MMMRFPDLSFLKQQQHTTTTTNNNNNNKMGEIKKKSGCNNTLGGPLADQGKSPYLPHHFWDLFFLIKYLPINARFYEKNEIGHNTLESCILWGSRFKTEKGERFYDRLQSVTRAYFSIENGASRYFHIDWPLLEGRVRRGNGRGWGMRGGFHHAWWYATRDG